MLLHFRLTDFNEQHLEKSPASSIDGISLDEGVESKGSTDETTNLGTSPSAYVTLLYYILGPYSFGTILSILKSG